MARGPFRVSSREFGLLPGGRNVRAITISNQNNVSATLLTYGATLQSFLVPDRNGTLADVVLGHNNITDYIRKPQYFGSTVGRFANRIGSGRFWVDGKEYHLQTNGGANALHGGVTGLDKILWDVVSMSSTGTASVVLGCVSPEGDQGYPGELKINATFSLDSDNTLSIEYRATTSSKTVVNITNHTYWNLAGEGSQRGTADHELVINAEKFLPTDSTALPTGETRDVAGTAFDFREQRLIHQHIRDTFDDQIAIGRGYDHNWIIGPLVTDQAKHMATLVDRVSGRRLEIWSNQPGLQFYSGNYLDGTVTGKAGQFYRMGDGLALEPQIFPDSPNHAHFPNAYLDRGETYINQMEFRFDIAQVPFG